MRNLFNYLLGRDGEPFPLPCATVVRQVTLDLSSAVTDSAVDLGTIRYVTAVTVTSLTGSASMKINGTGPVDLVEGQVRDQLDASSLSLSSDGDSKITLEIHGRP